MTVLFLVALGFLAALAYGTVALGVVIHVVFERLARKLARRITAPSGAPLMVALAAVPD